MAMTYITEIAGAVYLSQLIMKLIDRLEHPRKSKSSAGSVLRIVDNPDLADRITITIKQNKSCRAQPQRRNHIAHRL